MLRLRGHHLLCLHGFRGLGYSPEFVSNMQAIQDRLRESPHDEIEVVDSPDSICGYCPHLSDNTCIKHGEESEPRISAKDRAVLARISLVPGERINAGELFERTADEFCEGLHEVCSQCSWRDLGWCEEGIKERSMCARHYVREG